MFPVLINVCFLIFILKVLFLECFIIYHEKNQLRGIGDMIFSSQNFRTLTMFFLYKAYNYSSYRIYIAALASPYSRVQVLNYANLVFVGLN